MVGESWVSECGIVVEMCVVSDIGDDCDDV